MGSEYLPQPDAPEVLEVGGRTFADWHSRLTTNLRTGEDESRSRTPGSRYGRTAEDCAWWAVAAGLVFMDSVEYEDPEQIMHDCMVHAVNDRVGVAELVLSAWDDMPECLAEHLGNESDAKGLLE